MAYTWIVEPRGVNEGKVERGGGVWISLIFLVILFYPPIQAHQRELFGGNLEPSKTLTTPLKNARQREKIASIWNVSELAKTGFALRVIVFRANNTTTFRKSLSPFFSTTYQLFWWNLFFLIRECLNWI